MEMNLYSGIAMDNAGVKVRGLFHVREIYSIQTKGVNPYNNSFELLTRDLKRLKRSGYRVVPAFRIQNKGKTSCRRSAGLRS